MRTAEQQRDWTQQGLQAVLPGFLEANFSSYRDFTAHEIFGLSFDDIYPTSDGCPPKDAGRPSLSTQCSSETTLLAGLMAGTILFRKRGIKEDIMLQRPVCVWSAQLAPRLHCYHTKRQVNHALHCPH